jgi:hypothetical protein
MIATLSFPKKIEDQLRTVWSDCLAGKKGLTLDFHTCYLTDDQIEKIIQFLIEKEVYLKISTIDLRDNRLTSVPVNLVKFSNLIEIYLDQNLLSSFPIFLFTLPCYVHLEGNPILVPKVDISFDLLQQKTDFFSWYDFPYLQEVARSFTTLHSLVDQVFFQLFSSEKGKTLEDTDFCLETQSEDQSKIPLTFPFLEDAIFQILWQTGRS